MVLHRVSAVLNRRGCFLSKEVPIHSHMQAVYIGGSGVHRVTCLTSKPVSHSWHGESMFHASVEIVACTIKCFTTERSESITPLAVRVFLDSPHIKCYSILW